MDSHAGGLGGVENALEEASKCAGRFVFRESFHRFARIEPVIAQLLDRGREVVTCQMQRVQAAAACFDLHSQRVASGGVTQRGEQFDAYIVEPEQHTRGFVTGVAPHPRGTAAENLHHFLLRAAEVLDSNRNPIGSLQHRDTFPIHRPTIAAALPPRLSCQGTPSPILVPPHK